MPTALSIFIHYFASGNKAKFRQPYTLLYRLV